MLETRPIVLASGSTTRQTMLAHAGIQFKVDPANVDESELKEDALSRGVAPPAIALELAAAKAMAISAVHPHAIVIGSDQILELEGALLSKVQNLAEAANQLQRLQGKIHHLHSAVVCCIDGQIDFQYVDTAQLTMWPLTEDEISAYLDQAGPEILGSVGCYQIEGKGVRLFREISGSQFTIMGMPLLPLLGYLRSLSTGPKENQP